MSEAVLAGKTVRLAAFDFEKDVEGWARWMQDTDYMRLLDAGPAIPHPISAIRSFLENEIGEKYLVLSIHDLAEGRTIGFVDLSGFDWAARSVWLSIGIGESEDRGRGRGTEALLLLARFAFEQLNLNRLSLSVFEYNQPAIRCYEKCGFVEEGRQRGFLNRFNRRWDMIFMGLLREDWQVRQGIG